MSVLKKLLIYLILPLLVIVALFRFSAAAGFAGILVYAGFLLYTLKETAFVLLGSMAYSKGDIEKAIAWFGRANKSGKANPRNSVSYAYLLLKSGKLEDSEKVLNSLLSSSLKQDDRMHAMSNLALVLWKKGELDEAVSMLEEVIKDFKTSNVYGSLGYLLILKGDLEKALEFNLEAYDYNSSNSIILDNLGQTYYLKGEYDRALEIYEKLMQSKPSFPEAYYNFGLVLAKKGDYERALQSMQNALNYRFTFLSTVAKEEITRAIENLEKRMTAL